MNIKFITHIYKAIVSATLILIISTPCNATIFNITGRFQMWDPSGSQTGNDDFTLTGTYDTEDPNSMTLASTQKFFGFFWTARDLQITETAGTVEVNACPVNDDGVVVDGSVVPEPGNPGFFIPCVPPITASMDIAEGQWGVQMLFDWNQAASIDVLNVWNVTVNADGSVRLTSTDFDNDGIAGAPMADGAFQGFNANFDLLLSPPFPIIITATQNGGTPVVLDPLPSAGNVTLDATVTDPVATSITYDWNKSDAAIINAAGSVTDNASLVIDQTDTGLVAGTTYNVSVQVTKTFEPGDTSISSTNGKITVASFNLTAIDTDLDTINDDVEGFIDTDGDRIPEFLDTAITATQLTVSPTDNSLGNVVTSEGTLALGNTSYQNAISTLSSVTTNNFGAATSVVTIGENDGNFFKTFCTGGCVDLTVNNVTSSSIQIVIPVDTALPDHALFRVHSISGWNGFIINDTNSIASAAANSTDPIDCPAPGLSTYSNSLTKGHRCVQLTIEDGGSNDADGTVNGTITVLGGVAELIITESTTNGVGSLFWLLLGFPAMLGFRRYNYNK